MSNVPLPAEQELEIKHLFGDVVTVKGYGPTEMHAHAAAQSAADNAALRERIKVLEDAIQHYESALRDAWPEGAKGASWEFWNKARIELAALEAK